jgi:hypothetical protein
MAKSEPFWFTTVPVRSPAEMTCALPEVAKVTGTKLAAINEES